MRNTLAIVAVVYAATLGGQAVADDSLTDDINKLLQKKWSEMWLGHDYPDAAVRKMTKELETITFPTTNGTVARVLGISEPRFGVIYRGCSFSFFPEFPATTTTYESCRLNKECELIVVRKTSFHGLGVTNTREWSAEIRRVKQSE